MQSIGDEGIMTKDLALAIHGKAMKRDNWVTTTVYLDHVNVSTAAEERARSSTRDESANLFPPALLIRHTETSPGQALQGLKTLGLLFPSLLSFPSTYTHVVVFPSVPIAYFGLVLRLASRQSSLIRASAPSL